MFHIQSQHYINKISRTRTSKVNHTLRFFRWEMSATAGMALSERSRCSRRTLWFKHSMPFILFDARLSHVSSLSSRSPSIVTTQLWERLRIFRWLNLETWNIRRRRLCWTESWKATFWIILHPRIESYAGPFTSCVHPPIHTWDTYSEDNFAIIDIDLKKLANLLIRYSYCQYPLSVYNTSSRMYSMQLKFDGMD